jgi:hypothetical protein
LGDHAAAVSLTAEHRWQREQIDAALAMIARFAAECAQQARLSDRRAKFWGALHLALGLPAAILAGLAGASALGDLFGKTVSGVIALSAEGLSAAIASLGATDGRRIADADAKGFVRSRLRPRITL